MPTLDGKMNPGKVSYPVDMFVTITAVTVEGLIPDPDSILQKPDQPGDVVKLCLFENTLFAGALVKNLVQN